MYLQILQEKKCIERGNFQIQCLDYSCICVINQLFQYCINGRECQHGHPSARKNLTVVDELLFLVYICVINLTMKVSLFGVSTKKTTYSVAVLANIVWKRC